jgi:hypothetical protein
MVESAVANPSRQDRRIRRDSSWRRGQMNAADVLRYGHQTVLGTLQGLPEREWETAGVCGVWSVKDIIAHLASFEWVLVDVLAACLEAGSTPHLDEFVSAPDFNDAQVERRRGETPQRALAEYEDAHSRVMRLVSRVATDTLRRPGTLPWYGVEYDMEDLFVYAYYGHKREHSAQIAVYADGLKGS